ncbi:MAG: hypothetical protein KA191_12215 [Verrucomicrobia bacterium]|jgi:hypothetical protein|nr:hypothetical protein [Verrucomicrobiota bacterium]OQC66161.1 MAG: hypothetical protein BWX48_01849 [Verrucomicrobia bacterium ADurb.Bin006]MDI9382231.1 hypothetical protein [Verrucomicrobiota bacterium]NMD22428.1 hypothetical protein [Verrucomicrobiota bacterium]HNU98980.1 hypothetical protein [Verrucomicrobiota bacterium]
MNNDKLEYADLLELLINGPVGGPRRWAAWLVLRMLETKGNCCYRSDDHLRGTERAQAAIASLRAAARALSVAEQGLLLRAILTLSWEQLRRNTGFSLRVPGILVELGKDLGVLPCLAAAESVVDQGNDAVRRYPLTGLLPEVRQPGSGLIFSLSARERKQLGVSADTIEFDRLTVAVKSFRGCGWEANLRPLVAWWIESLDHRDAARVVRGLFPDIRRAAKDDQARWRALGLLDWLVDHPDHPTAGEAMTVAREVARADVRKAAADLAAALGQWEVLEWLTGSDRDRSVRERAEKLLQGRVGPGASGGQDELFG